MSDFRYYKPVLNQMDSAGKMDHVQHSLHHLAPASPHSAGVPWQQNQWCTHSWVRTTQSMGESPSIWQSWTFVAGALCTLPPFVPWEEQGHVVGSQVPCDDSDMQGEQGKWVRYTDSRSKIYQSPTALSVTWVPAVLRSVQEWKKLRVFFQKWAINMQTAVESITSSHHCHLNGFQGVCHLYCPILPSCFHLCCHRGSCLLVWLSGHSVMYLAVQDPQVIVAVACVVNVRIVGLVGLGAGLFPVQMFLWRVLVLLLNLSHILVPNAASMISHRHVTISEPDGKCKCGLVDVWISSLVDIVLPVGLFFFCVVYLLCQSTEAHITLQTLSFGWVVWMWACEILIRVIREPGDKSFLRSLSYPFPSNLLVKYVVDLLELGLSNI